MKPGAPTWLAVVLLVAACADRSATPATPTPAGAFIRLSRVTIVGAHAGEREACEQSIVHALRRRGIERGEFGTRVEIDVVIWETPVTDPWFDQVYKPYGVNRPPVPPRVEFTADLSATIHASDGPANVVGTGSSEALGAKGACEAASERTANAIAMRVRHP